LTTDPLKGPSGSSRYWTTVNGAEALPGVPTPLNWSWYDEATERAMVAALVSMGAEPRGTLPSPDRDQRHLGIFFGRCALNVDKWRAMADAFPGTSGTALERDILGASRPGKPTSARPRRYPFVAAMAPRAMERSRKALRDGAEAHRDWWRAAVARVDGGSEEAARAAFAEAFADYERVALLHLVATMGAQGSFDGVARLCARIGRPELASALTTGLGSTEEGDMLAELWRLARGGGSSDEFLSRYGSHGPGSGEIANPSWRADPARLAPLLARYATLDDDQAPGVLEQRQRAAREQAERALFAALPRLARGPARVLVRIAQIYMPMRETGRATILRSVDAARAAATVIGMRAAADGRMERPDDVYMCTVGEVLGRAPSADELAFRRERWEGYKRVELPPAWDGIPVPFAIAVPDDDSDTLTGIGASGGVVEGLARVVTDPTVDDELEPGEILVCYTTDPSWASLFLFAGAVVIDIGGAMSHGAIVAREMGIPCVINVRDGTRRLHTGDHVRVDGGTGIVERLARA
jgi:pyruvate,water dikinase